MKHTPTPWTVHKKHFRDVRITQQVDPDVHIAAMENWQDKYMDEQAANAAFIVQACNNFEALLDAAQESRVLLIELLRQCGEDEMDDCPTPGELCGNRLCDEVGCVATKTFLLRQAIANATGEPAAMDEDRERDR